MPQRPYWSGQIRIALITLPIRLFTATRRSAQIALHELERGTSERIHHRNVTEDGRPVPDEKIIKAFEYKKNEYIPLEKKEIENIKLPSSETLELTEFVDVGAIPVFHYERPYFVEPEGKDASEIYDVICAALRETNLAGIGQIALHGREELCAVLAFKSGMILEMLRYDREMQPLPAIYEREPPRVKQDYLSLAKQLIKQNTQEFDLSRYHDAYHEALMELIEARKEHRSPSFPARAQPAKVVNFMDALRRSLKEKQEKSPQKARKRARGGR